MTPSSDLMAERIKAAVSLPDVMRHLGHEGWDELTDHGGVIFSPLRADGKSPAFNVSVKNGVWLWNDHGMAEGGTVIDYWKEARGGDNGTAIRELAETFGLDRNETYNAASAVMGRAFREKQGQNGHTPPKPTKLPAVGREHTALDWRALAEAVTDADVERLAEERGYSLDLCRWMRKTRLIGKTEGGQWAFPVSTKPGGGNVIRTHIKGKDFWMYWPLNEAFEDEGKAVPPSIPLVIGDIQKAKEIHAFESQWDMLATIDGLGWHRGECADLPPMAWVATRGASNCKFLDLLEIPKGTKLTLWPQKDCPDVEGRIPSEQWVDAMMKACPDQTLSRVDLPLPAPADHNDLLRQGTLDFEWRALHERALRLTTGSLPPTMTGLELLESDIEPPPFILDGLVHQGAIMLWQGGSKSMKSWVMLDLAVSVCGGLQFWDRFDTTEGKVMFLNFELPAHEMKRRLKMVVEGKEVDPAVTANLTLHNLRGHAADYSKLLPVITEQIRGGDYRLIVIDPLYAGLGDRNENEAGAMMDLLTQVLNLSEASGAATAITHHFSKGNKSGQEAIDRGSGSGVLGRFPDMIITMTPHSEEDHFTITSTPRMVAPIAEYVMAWQFPLFVPGDEELDPKDLKAPPKPASGSKTNTLTAQELCQWIVDEEINGSRSSVKKQAADHFECSQRTIERKMAAAEKRQVLCSLPSMRGQRGCPLYVDQNRLTDWLAGNLKGGKG